MKELVHKSHHLDLGHALEEEIASALRNLQREKKLIVAEFVAQIAALHDPDVVKEFVAWRADPRIESLLQLASEMDDEELDQLVFEAEGLAIARHQRRAS